MSSHLGVPDGAEPVTVQEPAAPFSTTFTFEWATAPLSMNQRLHHIVKAKLTAELRSLMHAAARHIPDLGRCEVRLVWFVNTRRLCDGLVDAEVVEDDTREFMVKHMPEIRYVKGCTPHFEFTVTELPA